MAVAQARLIGSVAGTAPKGNASGPGLHIWTFDFPGVGLVQAGIRSPYNPFPHVQVLRTSQEIIRWMLKNDSFTDCRTDPLANGSRALGKQRNAPLPVCREGHARHLRCRPGLRGTLRLAS